METQQFLRVVFDPCLNWEVNVRGLIKSCSPAKEIFRTIISTRGADRTNHLLFYRFFTLYKLNYGSEVYSFTAKPLLRLLNSIHHDGIRRAIGIFHTSRVGCLLCDAGEPPLNLRLDELVIITYTQFQHLSDSPKAAFSFTANLDDAYIKKIYVPKPFGVRTKIFF